MGNHTTIAGKAMSREGLCRLVTKEGALPEEYRFLRLRAMQLLDEGLNKEARRLFIAINKVQMGRIAESLEDSGNAKAYAKANVSRNNC